ncbi:MAG: antitoxin [Dehalococcoidia bacterium]|nr:antitoxin [Dehalococcoidia bacterium]
MRTTLTLDDDVADALRERARLLNIPFKQVVNDTLRRGMSPAAKEVPLPEYRVVPNHSALASGIDPLKLNQINDQLDAEAFVEPSAN